MLSDNKNIENILVRFFAVSLTYFSTAKPVLIRFLYEICVIVNQKSNKTRFMVIIFQNYGIPDGLEDADW